MVASFGIDVKSVELGLGKHAGCVSPNKITEDVKLEYIEVILLFVSTLFSRVSVCIFLLRIFSINIHWRWTLYSIMALTVVANITCIITVLTECRPLAKLWNPTTPGSCWQPHVVLRIGQWQGGESLSKT